MSYTKAVVLAAISLQWPQEARDPMAPEQIKMIKFEIKSLDPGRKTIETIPEVENLSAELQAVIAAKYPGTTVQIRRVEGMPVHLVVQHVLLQVDWHAVASGVEKAAAAFATTEFLKLMKQKFRNIFTKPVDTGEQSPQADAHAPSPPSSASTKPEPTKKPDKDGSSKGKSHGLKKHRK
jgi:hypothetical protein